jgi:DNA-binding XRE family transcriptional regulator
MPMSEIIARIPGKSDPERARAIRVSHQALFNWKKGLCRPEAELAERVARVTGLRVETITGR